jgi:hypothetical protein
MTYSELSVSDKIALIGIALKAVDMKLFSINSNQRDEEEITPALIDIAKQIARDIT